MEVYNILFTKPMTSECRMNGVTWQRGVNVKELRVKVHIGKVLLSVIISYRW